MSVYTSMHTYMDIWVRYEVYSDRYVVKWCKRKEKYI